MEGQGPAAHQSLSGEHHVCVLEKDMWECRSSLTLRRIGTVKTEDG